MAPPAGLEPATSWLTVMRSANWAKEDYMQPAQFFCADLCYFFLFRLVVIQDACPANWAKEE